MKEFKNKVAAITGSATGIGRAFAEEAAKRGMRLALIDINTEGLEETKAICEKAGAPKVVTIKTDVTKYEEVRFSIMRVMQEYGQLDLMFANAGIATAGWVYNHPPQDWAWAMNTNVLGLTYYVHEVLPIFKKQGTPCHFLFTASIAGLITGLLHTLCGIPAILSGILTQLALYSINLRIMAVGSGLTTKATLSVSVDKYPLMLSSRYIRDLSAANPFILLVPLVLIVIMLLYWFFGTELGSSLRATGANQSMARAQGINTNTAKVLGLVVSNGLVALAGGLLAQYQGSATIDMGRGAIVIGLAAVIIGEVLLDKVFRNFALKLLSAVIGAIIYYVVITVVLRLGLESTDLKLLTALVVAVFLAVPYWKGRYFTKPVRKEGAPHA